MTLKLYNTLSRSIEEFKPINPEEVGFYSCGPTVYWFQHIGNLRTYIFNDILKRVVLYEGFKIKHVMNYTDVGHLTSDADEGEDKMEKAIKRENKTAKEISEFYASEFEKDCKKLNIIAPDVVCKATEHIPEQIELIKTLEEKGYTYKTSDGVYFDTSKFEDYCKLGKINEEGLEAGKRVDIGEKKNKTDFALWKFSEEAGIRQQEWESPWGLGFPGWHIECSAMSSKYLGEQFDLHTGGEDHVQVHHTNEIAQSECAFGKTPWVKYWVHGAYLTFKGEKVSKSQGGLYTISELEKQGYDPLSFRYLCLNTIYRKQLAYSNEVLDGAKNSFERLKKIIIDLKTKEDSNKTESFDKYKTSFVDSIEDDLNMPKALSVMWDVLRDTELGSKEKLELVYDFDKIFALGIEDMQEEVQDIPTEIQELAQKRWDAKESKDWDTADKIRDELKDKGYVIEDSKNGFKVKKI